MEQRLSPPEVSPLAEREPAAEAAVASSPSVRGTREASLDWPHRQCSRAQSQPPDLFADLSQHKELDRYLQSPSPPLSMALSKSPTERTVSPWLDCGTKSTPPPPASRPSQRPIAAAASEAKLSEEPTTPTSSRDDVFTAIDAEAAALFDLVESPSSSPSSSGGGGRKGGIKGDSKRKQLQNLVLSTSRVGRVCFVTPRAGSFEGRFVALVAAAAPPPYGRDTHLIPPTELEAGRRQVQELRTAVLEWAGDTPRPDVWIVLRSMALDGQGEPDARRLQTWVQNVPEEVEEQIMDMQLFRHRLGDSMDTNKRRDRGGARRQVHETPTLPLSPAEARKESAVWGAMDAGAESPGNESEFFPLSLMQQLFFRTTMKRSIESAAVCGAGFRFSQSILLRVRGGGADLADIEAAIDVLACRHAMLRARFRLTGDGWAQVIAPAATRSYRFEHKYADDDDDDDDDEAEEEEERDDGRRAGHAEGAGDEGKGKSTTRGGQADDEGRRRAKKRRRKRKNKALLAIMEQAQSSLNVFRGPVFAAQHIRTRNNHQLLYLVAHHLVVDVVSWRVLLDDLDSLLRHGTLASPSSPSLSMAFPRWAERQSFEGSQRVVDPVLSGGHGGDGGHSGHDGGGDDGGDGATTTTTAALAYWVLRGRRNCYADTAQLGFSLTPDAAASLVGECNAVFRTESADILVASLLHSFRQTFPDRRVPTVWKQHHGRDGARGHGPLDTTVGWFTTLCPLAVAAADAETDLVQLVRLVKDTRCAVLAARHGGPSAALAAASAAICSSSSASSAASICSSTASSLPTSKFSTSSSAPASPSHPSAIPVEIMFNCVETLCQLGRDGGILEPIAAPDREFQSLISDIGPRVGRIALFEVSVVIDAAGARVEFLFNAHAARRDRIVAWMNNFEHSLLEAVGRLRVMKPQLTLADAPLLDTSYDAMARLAASRLAAVGLDCVASVDSLGPVDPVQQEMLVVQAQTPDAFHVSCTYELVDAFQDRQRHRPLDRDRLCGAWASLVAMHPSLRTIFIETISERSLFDRVILKAISPCLSFVESSDPLQTLASLPAMELAACQPRHRLSISMSSTQTYLRLDASQVICDPASIHTLISQLCRMYAGESVHLLGAPSPKRHRHISSQDTTYRLEAWGISPGVAAPCLFPRLAFQSKGRIQTRGFDLNISPARVLGFCREHGLEPSILVSLSWALVLRAFVGADMISFGYLSPGREQTLPPHRLQNIGSFAALVPCVMDLSNSNMVVMEVLKGLQALLREVAKGESPTVAEIEHALGLAGEPLFNTCVSFQDATQALRITDRVPSEASVWQPELVASSLIANCELSLSVTRLGNRLRGDITYHHLTADQAHNVGNSFERALHLILDAPARPVSDIDLFTERDYRQITTPDWDPCQTDTKVSACIHQLVTQQARRRPRAIAVSAWDGDLSYQQLEASITKLATHLANRGIGPGVLVPLVLDKCMCSPIAMLAVLKAGGCFVALDSQDLATSLSIIKQLAPSLVLVTGLAWKHVSPAVSNCVLVDQSALGALPPQVSFDPHEPIPEQAACAFLSPGTTKPKGFFFTHQSLCSILSVQGPALKIHEGSRVLQLSAFNVDVALVEIFCTLLHGGCVCIPSESERIDDLGGAIARMNVTWSYMTPVLARRLEPAKVPSLKTICFRTRSLDQDVYRSWLPKTDILVAYGAPDVCPLAISVLQVHGPDETDVISPPLMGRFLVLNPKDPRRMVPVGATGELAIDSPLVTPHTFVPGQPLMDPEFLREPQANPKWRYLRTGHVARHIDRGHVRLVTSQQDEVSVNGTPVLVNDIERQVRRCLAHGVDVAVEPITTSDSISLLAAFLDLGHEPGRKPYDLNCLGPEVKQKLFAARRAVETSLSKSIKAQKELPWQCIPAVFVPVRGLPLSVSLKVNRRRLRRMVASMTYTQLMGLADGQYTGLRTPPLVDKPLPLTKTEESMRLIWAGVLGAAVSAIRPSDSFLDAGGNKLLAARLVVSCRQGGFDVSIRQVLQGATLTDICRSTYVADSDDEDEVRGGGKAAQGLPVGETWNRGPYEGLIDLVLAPQLGISRHDVLEAAEATSQQSQSIESGLYQPRGDIGCLVLDFHGPVQAQRLEAACEALTMIHLMLRTAFAVHECRAYQVAVASFRAPFRYRCCPARSLDGEANMVMQQDQRLPLRLGRPVTEFTYLEGGGGKQGKLLMRFSTAQMTEGSAAHLVQDLIRLYENPDSVPPRPSFLQFAQASQAAARRRDSVRHWKTRLAGSRMTRVVPQSGPCGPAADRTALHETVDVAPLGDVGISFDTVLKTAWAMVLARLSGRADVVFGELVEGRRRRTRLGAKVDAPSSSPSSSMVGPLDNTVPVRIRFPRRPSSALHMMQLVQRECASSLAHEALGGQAIIRECTEWPGWTQFGTVVRHRCEVPADGSATLNMDNTALTYKTTEAPARTVPDLMASSTAIGPARVALALEFSAGRMPADFTSAVMDLFVGAVKALACFETLGQMTLPAAGEYENKVPRVLLEKRDGSAAEHEPLTGRLPSQHRKTLQTFLTKTWADVLCPGESGSEAGLVEASRFYDVSGTVLPACLLAGCINAGIGTLGIAGLETIHVTPGEVIAHPTVPAQIGLIARKMNDFDVNPRPARRKTVVGLSLRNTGTPDGSSFSSRPTLEPRVAGSQRSHGPRAWSRQRHRGSLSRDSIRQSPKREVVIHPGDGSVERAAEPVHISTVAAQGEFSSPGASAQAGWGEGRRFFPSWSLRQASRGGEGVRTR